MAEELYELMKQFHRARMQASRSPCQTLGKCLLTGHLP